MSIDWTKPIETMDGLPCMVVHTYGDGDRTVVVGVGTRHESAETFDGDGKLTRHLTRWIEGIDLRNVVESASD